MRGIIEKIDNNKFTIIDDENIKKEITIKQTKKAKKDYGITMEDVKEGFKIEFDENTSPQIGTYYISKILENNSKPQKKNISVQEVKERLAKATTKKDDNEKSCKHRYAYNFISYNEDIKRTKRVMGENTGTISIVVETLTPTSVEEFGTDNYVIQGSSLKGVIRNLIEAVSNSCFKHFKEEKYKEFGGQLDFKNSFPKILNACNTFNNTCYACNIFGTTDIIEKKEVNNNIKDINRAQSSKLFFSDAVIIENKKV